MVSLIRGFLKNSKRYMPVPILAAGLCLPAAGSPLHFAPGARCVVSGPWHEGMYSVSDASLANYTGGSLTVTCPGEIASVGPTKSVTGSVFVSDASATLGVCCWLMTTLGSGGATTVGDAVCTGNNEKSSNKLLQLGSLAILGGGWTGGAWSYHWIQCLLPPNAGPPGGVSSVKAYQIYDK
jgi:hypothetical protein